MAKACSPTAARVSVFRRLPAPDEFDEAEEAEAVCAAASCTASQLPVQSPPQKSEPAHLSSAKVWRLGRSPAPSCSSQWCGAAARRRSRRDCDCTTPSCQRITARRCSSSATSRQSGTGGALAWPEADAGGGGGGVRSKSIAVAVEALLESASESGGGRERLRRFGCGLAKSWRGRWPRKSSSAERCSEAVSLLLACSHATDECIS
mmetsp:Transcript_14766/g.44312  ORF Transcript_14766/g.44312 Transcript_14766/m.44312 type:complete len:206 (+) Transcript_14766:343-960(+)